MWPNCPQKWWHHLNSHTPPVDDKAVSINLTGALVIRLPVCGSDNLSLFYLICISLIMNEVEHLFICLLAICIPFWTAFFISFALYFVGLFIFFLYSFLWVLCQLRKFVLWFILQIFLLVCHLFSFYFFILYLFIIAFLLSLQRSF